MKRWGFLVPLLLLLLLPVQAAAKPPADGQYTIEVALSGGSGRATVESPAELTVTDGEATAVIVWSSPYYEYMRIDGTCYYPVNADGNSTFEIPAAFNEDLAVVAQTVAMSEPHEIEYTLYFDSATLKPRSDGAVLAPLAVAAAVLIALAAAGLLIAARRRAGAAGRRREHRI